MFDTGGPLTFKELTIHDWRQFQNVRINFGKQLTVLTGPNGTGKTSILNVLSGHFSWLTQFMPGLRRGNYSGAPRWGDSQLGNDADPFWHTMGTLTYSNSQLTSILIPQNPGVANYSIHMPQQQPVNGLHLPSHRLVMGRTAVPHIPSSFSSTEPLLEGFLQEIRQRYSGSGYSSRPPALVMKESLLAAQMYGEGSSSRRPNVEARDIWSGFQDVLRAVLPSTLGFERLTVDPPEVILETRSGSFALDAVSGGISALFELTWQIFLRSRTSEAFTVLFDEPENHLHPALQRDLMPTLLAAFPRVSFVISTHSPFIVTSVPESFVYVLRPSDSGVTSELLDHANMGATSDETLRDVLGLDTTLPKWAERELASLSDEFLRETPSPTQLEEFRLRLNALGMGSRYTYLVNRAIRGQND